MKNVLNQIQIPYSAEGVTMEAVSHMTLTSITGITERRELTMLSLNITVVCKIIYIRAQADCI